MTKQDRANLSVLRGAGNHLKALVMQHTRTRRRGSVEIRALHLYTALRTVWSKHATNSLTMDFDDVAFAAYLNAFWGGPWDADGAEQLVEDDELFWMLFVLHYVMHDAPFAAMAQIKQSMLRRARLSVPLARRTFWASFVAVCERFAYEGRLGVRTKLTPALAARIAAAAEQDATESMKRLKAAVGANSRLTIYRGFAVPTEASVRTGRLLVKNANAHQQDWGRGLSYSLRREVALGFALHRVRRNVADRTVYEPLIAPYGYSIARMLSADSKPVAAKFSADLRDVLLVASRMNQDEVIIDPDVTRLERYQFVNRAREKAAPQINF